jgi:D-alanyl-D-alanine carboxypeptidase
MIAKAKLPGATVLVLDRGSTILNAAYGVKNLLTNAPVTTDTHFEIGSITKQFTAAAILQLKEQGKLSLDDPLAKYVPEYTRAKGITIKQLLWHESGIPDFTDAPNIEELVTKKRGSFAAILALVKDKPLEFTPGAKEAYSNTNYEILGRIVELASGMSWDNYTRSHLFAPAAMTDSTFMSSEAHTKNVATGYAIDRGRLVPQPSLGDWASSAGGIISTTRDLAKWNTALFGGRIVSPSDLRLMTTSGHLLDGSATGYGFGLLIDTYDGQQRYWHNGATFGFKTVNVVYPRLDQQIIVLGNDVDVLVEGIASAIFSKLHPDLAAAANKAAVGEDKAITAQAKTLIRQFAAGHLERSQFTARMNATFPQKTVMEIKDEIAPLGYPTTFVYLGKRTAMGETVYSYLATFAAVASPVHASMTLDKHNKIDDYELKL